MSNSRQTKLNDILDECIICERIFSKNDKINENYLTNITFSPCNCTLSRDMLRKMNPTPNRFVPRLYSCITDLIIEHIISVENE